MELIKFMFSGFWVFVGFMIILSAILKFMFLMWNRFVRHLNIRKHGWPPEYCDADGDFRKDDEDEEKTEITIG